MFSVSTQTTSFCFLLLQRPFCDTDTKEINRSKNSKKSKNRMSLNRDSKNEGNNSNKNRKRDFPEDKEWQWEDTALADPKNTSMLAQDVKTLLLTRGEKQKNLKGRKEEMIGYLKENHQVELKEDWYEYNVKELIVELRLRKLDDSQAKKDILVQRLKGEIDASVGSMFHL